MANKYKQYSKAAEKRSCLGRDRPKIRYKSRKAAQLIIDNPKRFKGRKKPKRAYKCPVCDGWHLTSKRKLNGQ